ncbi:hypothetical protein [Lacticaseibacillus sharpeae]|uniref:Uncharacterized protein n=1 Tax=Lacticaseibacillus sharpeae JCM 1186 = DSM 20505 TaxID=1291052 RepID=A0A0R1ZLJ2_9LACO|nr:hypothetical protein [Lacticaseibacillus sharpeae]KRM55896.1 hypothetical protein FC18_GL000948 [Lacticaseibacillus sharpeae JCM 1186 = DSM 20505]
MEIDNNQLVQRYMKLQSANRPYFLAVKEYIDLQIGKLYKHLETSFQDTVTLSIMDAVEYAEGKGQKLPLNCNATLATQNYIFKCLDNLGILVEGNHAARDIIIGKLNFENRARYI